MQSIDDTPRTRGGKFAPMEPGDEITNERSDTARQSPAKRQSAGSLHGDLTAAIIGAMFDVHTTLGFGFLESAYANALTVALRALGLQVERNVAFEIFYRGQRVGRYVADLIVEARVVVETTVARSIEATHRAQLLNYLRASGLEVGLVLNFGTSAQFKRVVSTAAPARRPVTSVRIVSDHGETGSSETTNGETANGETANGETTNGQT
jgi:GxxExxY protein